MQVARINFDTVNTVDCSARIQNCSGLLVLVCAWLWSFGSYAQGPGDGQVDASVRRCQRVTGGLAAGGLIGGLVLLDQAWYADFERAPMHSFNDGDEWLQMDKLGHAFSAYTLSSWGHAMADRCQPGRRGSLWVGASVGLAFLTGVELLDGTSAEWGFSWWDMAANVAGTGLYVGQELLWGEQRARLKYSAHRTGFPSMRPELLGEGALEPYLKDYNGMTIWLSVSPGSFSASGSLPKWLSVAFGMGAEGMITASTPKSPDDLGGDLARYRQFYLAPDLDLTRIRTRSKVLRTALFILNSVKVPAPTLEYRGGGKWVGHLFYF